MARRKSLIRIPFLKFKINKQTIFNICGFLLIGIAIILFVSFLKNFASESSGKVLYKINTFLVDEFGGLAIFIPFIILLISAHFFNSRKLKLIRANISVGGLLIFVSLLGTFKSGQIGQMINENLTLDFSVVGAILILGTIFIIGLLLFLDTSIDSFIIFLIKGIKFIVNVIKNYFFRSLSEKKLGGVNTKKDQVRYVEDQKVLAKKQQRETATTKQGVNGQLSDEFVIKPLSKNVKSAWVYPPISLLADIEQTAADRGDVKKNAKKIETTLDSFGIRARVNEVNEGPAITQYAISLPEGTKLSKVTALSDNMAFALATSTGQVRIEAPIPGRSLVGIEVPNIKPEIVTLKKMLTSPSFANNNDPLLVPLGLNVSGEPQAATIEKMPHVLIAGQTGAGKSVLLNSWICTFLFRTKPEDLRMIMVDPKRVELSRYNGIPHLLTEVISDPDPKKTISALRWTIAEMENRYKLFAEKKVLNLEGYNSLTDVERRPYILFIIDELATLMSIASAEAEECITRIAQLSRATGIHLLLATQRPSVDVITGLMKANIPTRVAFNVSSMVDSRVIIDMPGAEKLLGRGDMLYLPPDRAKPVRIQGPFITEKEVSQLVKFLKMQTPVVNYTEEITEQEVSLGHGGTVIDPGSEKDHLFNSAVEIITQHDKASASLLQRRLSIGYARAARILDQLEAAGYVGPSEGSKPREVLKRTTNTEPTDTV